MRPEGLEPPQYVFYKIIARSKKNTPPLLVGMVKLVAGFFAVY